MLYGNSPMCYTWTYAYMLYKNLYYYKYKPATKKSSVT